MQINGPIERGIPAPCRKARNCRISYKIDDLAVGESRLFMAHPSNVRAAIWPRAKAMGIKLVSAAEGDGIRVWRVA